MPPVTPADDNAAQQQAEQDKPLTRADLLALFAQALPEAVNKAVSSHTKRLQKSFDERFAALSPASKAEGEAEETETVDPLLAGAKPAPAGTAPPPKPAPPAVDPRVAALEKQLAKLSKESEAAQRQAATERRARLDADGYASVTRALTGRVTPGAEDLALSALRGRGAIVIDDEGAVRLRLRAKDEPEEGLDLSEGIASFLKSPEAKFLAPVPAAPPPQRRIPPTNSPAVRSAAQQSSADPVAAFEAKHGNLGDAL